jgi:hypothetical protein
MWPCWREPRRSPGAAQLEIERGDPEPGAEVAELLQGEQAAARDRA